MRYLALATDYDGTLAENGVVHPNTLSALKRLRETGRHAILVTGRELPDVMKVFPEYPVFERIVAENGALLYDPVSKRETVLAQAPPVEFARALAQKGVAPLVVARVLLATLENQKNIVLETIQELGLELQMIFNKGALMVLPSGVNKATGLTAALKSLSSSLRNTVAVGDAENDHALLRACECGVSVANALPSLKEASDWVTIGSAGEGVTELINQLVEDDLASIPTKDHRDAIPVDDIAG